MTITTMSPRYILLKPVDNAVTMKGDSQALLGSAARKRGPWGSWSWDGATLSAQVDRHGFYPFFHARVGNGIALSTSIVQLLRLGARNTFDDAAISAFLRLGFFLGDDTPFTDIRAFPPGGKLTWCPDKGVTITGGPIKRNPDIAITRAQAVSGYVDLFRSAIQNGLPDDPSSTVLPLSGGRDSRHIALELHRIGFTPGLVISQKHFRSRNDEDSKVASLLCDEFNWPLTIQPQLHNPVDTEIEKNRLFDCLTDEHAWFLPSARTIQSRKFRFAYDGIAGDALSNGLFSRKEWLQNFHENGPRKFLNVMPAYGYGTGEPTLDTLLTDEFRKRWNRETALARMEQEFSCHQDQENPPYAFMFWNRTRREIAPFLPRYLPETEVLAPYLDDEVFDFLWNLPTELVIDNKFHDEAIASAAPRFRHIPYEQKGVPARTDLHTLALMRGMALRAEFWIRKGEVSILNRSWLRPRLLASLINPNIGLDAAWYASWPAWLASLEILSNQSTHISKASDTITI